MGGRHPEWCYLSNDNEIAMRNNKKQEIYLRIMSILLPEARNVQTWPALRRWRVNLYPELELVHGIPQLLENPEFTVFDVYWINTQAKNYSVMVSATSRFGSNTVLALIDELVAEVPEELQDKLSWHGSQKA